MMSYDIIHLVPTVAQIPLPGQGAVRPLPVQEATPPISAPPTKPTTAVEAPKSNKKTKEKKKVAAAAPTLDVSRLDLRIGRIVNAYKHPNADTLYVEEGTNHLVLVESSFACYRIAALYISRV